MRLYTLDGKKCNISGERIRQWRLNAGLTQEELAIKMQLSGLQMGQMAISRIETGKRLVADFELKIVVIPFSQPPQSPENGTAHSAK